MTQSSPSDDGVRLSAIIHAVEGVEIVMPGPPRLGAAALAYAVRYGWPIFPIRARGKTPLTSNGFHDASTDVAQIREWWTRWPDANVATPTGVDGCGYDVVDVDGLPGMTSLQQLRAAGELPTVHAVAFTPGDPTKDRAAGRHLFVEAQNQQSAVALMSGIDVRANGGYVVLAPSVALHGVAYAWLSKPPELS